LEVDKILKWMFFRHFVNPDNSQFLLAANDYSKKFEQLYLNNTTNIFIILKTTIFSSILIGR